MRLKEDSSSWQCRGIKRRDYRHDYGTPEVPRHKGNRRKPKHEHDYLRRVIGKTTQVQHYQSWHDGQWLRREYEIDKVQYVCTRCGHKQNYTPRGWR